MRNREMKLSVLRALRSRNFRLFFAGQSISLIGTWMTRVATSWLVYRLTRSPFLLGLATFAGQAPLFFVAPLAGPLVDRWNRHRALIVTQVLSLVQSFALAGLALTGSATTFNLILLMLMQGLINAFDMPVRQSFVIQMVETRDELPNAIALNSSMVNVARLLGPAIAGLVIAQVGEGICFLADGISYGAVIVSLLMMRIRTAPPPHSVKRVREEMAEGWRYVTGSLPIRSILLLLALVSLLGMPYTVLMPIFAARILHGGAHTLGWLMACTGVGALVASIGLAGRKSVLGLGRSIPISAGLFGASLIGFGFSTKIWLSMATLLISGFGMIRHLAASNTIVQTIVDDEKRGRVMAFYAMAFAGMAPFGSLLAGTIASKFGAPHTVIASGIFCIGGAAWFAYELPRMRQVIRPIYVELGILPGREETIATAAIAAEAEETGNPLPS